MILLCALLIWNLIEYVLRKYIGDCQKILPGWDNKPTTRPTSYMMSTKFSGLQVLKIGRQRRLAKPLTEVQGVYLTALGLSEKNLLAW